MKTSAQTYRTTAYLLSVLLISAGLAACGGGGGSSTSPGTSGPATVRVSIASAPSFPAGTTFASSTLSPTTAASSGNSTTFDNVFVTVTKLALIPSTGPEFPDANGELEMQDSSSDKDTGFVTATLATPVKIDLRNLSGDNVAMLLNEFSGVSAGNYSKIRVYYDNVVGHNDDPPTNTVFHQTANFHFDVHFVGGNLVIPVTSATDNGIKFVSVVIEVVGLKITTAGKNVLMRPQVFAKVVDEPIQYEVTGYADNVASDGTFDILTLGGRSIPAAFSGGTSWAYSDNVFNESEMVISRPASVAVAAFQDRAEVSAIGFFDDNLRLQASQITFTFPDIRIGKTFSTWSVDNTYFYLNLPLDNLVYAIPNKTNPLYTNFQLPPIELVNGYNLIAANSDNTVKARGYAPFTGSQGPGLRAFWISIDNNILQ